MDKALLIAWLAAYSVLPAVVALFALIFAFEGAASLRTHPENLVLTIASILFLIGWPLSALGSWILLFFGRLKPAWLVSLGTAGVLTLLAILGLVLASFLGRH